MSLPRLLVVMKTTSYRTYVEERQDPLTTKLLAANDPAVGRVLGSHRDHETTVAEVRAAIAELDVPTEFVSHADLRRRDLLGIDLVLTVGGDGTLLTASHAVDGRTPILGVNSAPDHSVGFFCGARMGTVGRDLARALAGQMARTVVSRMEVELNGTRISRRVLNDALFCHEVPAASSRYILSFEDAAGIAGSSEEQKSSGLWIGPAAGSTAAQRSAGGRILPLTSKRIQYVVREPYTPRGRPLSLSRGTVEAGETIVLRSKMRQARLFLDGPHVMYEVGLGDIIRLRRSEEVAHRPGAHPNDDVEPGGRLTRHVDRPNRRANRAFVGDGFGVAPGDLLRSRLWRVDDWAGDHGAGAPSRDEFAGERRVGFPPFPPARGSFERLSFWRARRVAPRDGRDFDRRFAGGGRRRRDDRRHDEATRRHPLARHEYADHGRGCARLRRDGGGCAGRDRGGRGRSGRRGRRNAPE